MLLKKDRKNATFVYYYILNLNDGLIGLHKGFLIDPKMSYLSMNLTKTVYCMSICKIRSLLLGLFPNYCEPLV